jgi:hypothetical protein
MKITKTLLKQIIKEELENAQENYENDLEKAATFFRDFYKEIYGIKPDVGELKLEDIEEKIKNLFDEQEIKRFADLVKQAKETSPSSDDPIGMRSQQ